MVHDHHCEKPLKEDAGHGKRRLESALQGCKNINKRQQGSGIKPTYMDTGRNGRVSKGASRTYNRNDENDDDDDDMSMVSVCEDMMESSEESMYEDMETSLSELDIVQMGNKPTMRGKLKREILESRKRKNSFNPHTKSKKRKIELAAELLDLSVGKDEKKRIQNEYAKYKMNHRNISKIEMAGFRGTAKKRKTGFTRKTERKPRAKPTSRGKSVKRRKKIKYDGEDVMSPDKSSSVKSEKSTEKKSSKQNMENENKCGGKVNNYNSDNPEKKGNMAGDNRNISNKKVTAEEKKAASAVTKGPGHGEITSKVSKENEKNDTNKVNKAKEKVDDLSKKVDQKEVKDVDEEVAMSLPNPRASRFRKPRQQSMKIMGMSSAKQSNKVPPFIKFYMNVYQELCESRSIRTIAKEAAKIWKGMTVEEKSMFNSKKTR